MARRYAFTLNNPVEQLDFSVAPKVRYAIWQLEKGENGTPHYQGYMVMESAVKLGGMKLIVPGAHFEPCKGTHEQNKAYCTKVEGRQEGPWTHGVEPEQGKRTDLVEIKEKLDAGVSMKQLASEHFSDFIRYERSFRAYRTLMTPERNFKTEVEVHWGVPGSGKSHYARSYAGAYFKPEGQWWCGYDNHEVVILDEFKGWLTPTFMLRLMDRYPLRVETKGGSVEFVAKKLIITSNFHWMEWWNSNVRFDREALERRFDVIQEYKERYVPPAVVQADVCMEENAPPEDCDTLSCETSMYPLACELRDFDLIE